MSGTSSAGASMFSLLLSPPRKFSTDAYEGPAPSAETRAAMPPHLLCKPGRALRADRRSRARCHTPQQSMLGAFDPKIVTDSPHTRPDAPRSNSPPVPHTNITHRLSILAKIRKDFSDHTAMNLVIPYLHRKNPLPSTSSNDSSTLNDPSTLYLSMYGTIHFENGSFELEITTEPFLFTIHTCGRTPKKGFFRRTHGTCGRL